MGKKNIPELPDYNNCLVNLANSILKRFDVPTTADTLPLADKYLCKGHRNVVVLLMDAMGISILEKHLSEDGFLRSHLAGPYNSVYPPTTVAATTSVMNGLYPNEHGWLGWDIYLSKFDKNVTIFRGTEQARERRGAKPKKYKGEDVWDRDSVQEGEPVADYNVGFTLLPYESIIDKINNAGGKAYYSMPFMPPNPKDIDAILNRVEDLCKEPGEKYIYAYCEEPDHTMHKTGTKSEATHEMVTELEKKIEEFASKLEDTLLIITADHGHMDSKNYCILDYPEVLETLERLPSIEPRTLNFFIKDEYKESFPEIFERNFGEGFLILTREEVLENKIFGIGKDRENLPEMIGDYIAFSTSDKSIFTTHLEAQLMPGGHAGLTPEEYIIPLIVVERD